MNKNWSEKMKNGFKLLKKIDPDFNFIMNKFGLPLDRASPNNFDTLVRIIIGQQISRQAAISIYKKISKNSKICVDYILKEKKDSLKNQGLSFKKIEYIKNLANMIKNKNIILEEYANLSSETIYKDLIQINGIGEWTINNYLLFSLQKVDAWPAGDLALQEAVKELKKISGRPNRNKMVEIALNWKPYRGAAALLLWHYYSKFKRKND